jgi:signal transduction histidine kinase
MAVKVDHAGADISLEEHPTQGADMFTMNNSPRISLRTKAILILSFVVLSVTLTGGWLYFFAASQTLKAADRQRASSLAESLCLAAESAMVSGHGKQLGRITAGALGHDDVRFVGVVDEGGAELATASRELDSGRWGGMLSRPAAVSMLQQPSDDRILLTRPIVARNDEGTVQLLGGLRLVIDTSKTAATLANVRRTMLLVVAAVVLAALPLSWLMVWRVLVRPVGQLARAAERLGEGDFTARSGLAGNDELGQLAGRFDRMADDLAVARGELVEANSELEKKVATRTYELERANSRLSREIEEKEDFLRAVSHDLSAPLRNIAGMATLILMKHRDELPEEVVARLNRIQINADAESALIAELLELSRVRTMPQRREAVDMNLLLAEVGGALEYELQQRDIRLSIQPGLPVLHVEKARLRQVFQNLIDNAIKYMHRSEGGRIDIGYRCDGLGHHFTVADNGPGIRLGDLEKVFRIFGRLETPATAKVPGKGVGLAFVRTVAANYDGRAWAESDQGCGAIFHVTLSVERTLRPPGRKPRAAFRGPQPTPQGAPSRPASHE